MLVGSFILLLYPGNQCLVVGHVSSHISIQQPASRLWNFEVFNSSTVNEKSREFQKGKNETWYKNKSNEHL